MPEIKEVFEDIKDKVGDKGFLILIGVAVIFGLIMFLKSSDNSSSEKVTTVTSVSSYPDSVTNANVIIDSIQNSIDYSEGIITEKIEALDDKIDTQFTATNNYISEGLQSAVDLNDKVTGLSDKVDVIGNITAETYYETMLHQGRDGYIDYDPQRALSVLENSGFNTSTENGTDKNGNLTDRAGSVDGGYTTFQGSNIKVS